MDTLQSLLVLLGIAIISGFGGALLIWCLNPKVETRVEIKFTKKDEDNHKDL